MQIMLFDGIRVTFLVWLGFGSRVKMVLHLGRLVDFGVNEVNVLVQVTFLVEFHITIVKMTGIWLFLGVDTQMRVELT